MTAVGDGTYEVHLPEGYDYGCNIIFCRMNPSTTANNWNNKWNQTSDLKTPTDGKNLYTQNIDGLHQMAGSKNVLELHGSVHRNYCTRCHKGYDARYMKDAVGIPLCECGGVIKPDVVLYEESLNGDTIEKAVEALQTADLLLIGGTSLAVYPAAGLIQYFGGKRIVLLNRDVTPYDGRATLCIREPIGQVLGQIVAR